MSVPPHSGQLRPVTVEYPTEGDGAVSGGGTVTWATRVANYMMQIRRKSQRERLANLSQVTAGAAAEGWGRYLSTITSKDRIVDGTDVWRIDGSPEDWLKKGEWWVFQLVMDE